MKFEEDDNHGIKRNNPFVGGNAPEPEKKSKIIGGGEMEDLELMMKTDSEISKTLARIKKHLQLLGDKLPDKGDKMKANLRRYEDELHRRNKFQSNKKDSAASSSSDRVAEDKPSDGSGVDALNEVVDLVTKTQSETRDTIVRNTKNLQTLGDKLPDNSDRIKAAPCRHEDELKLQSNKKDSTTSSPGLVAGNKPSESHSGVATNGLTVDATKHDSLTDEKMQKIVNELVNVGISETDVGKAAEICYNDAVKVKVLFALPSHLRKFYVWGFFTK